MVATMEGNRSPVQPVLPCAYSDLTCPRSSVGSRSPRLATTTEGTHLYCSRYRLYSISPVPPVPPHLSAQQCGQQEPTLGGNHGGNGLRGDDDVELEDGWQQTCGVQLTDVHVQLAQCPCEGLRGEGEGGGENGWMGSSSPVAFSSLMLMCSLLSALAKAWVQGREEGGREGGWVGRSAPVMGRGAVRSYRHRFTGLIVGFVRPVYF